MLTEQVFTGKCIRPTEYNPLARIIFHSSRTFRLEAEGVQFIQGNKQILPDFLVKDELGVMEVRFNDSVKELNVFVMGEQAQIHYDPAAIEVVAI